MCLHSDRYGAGNPPQEGGFRNRIEYGVDEILYPARIEVPRVVLLDYGAVYDAGLSEVSGTNDGAVSDRIEPINFNLSPHILEAQIQGTRVDASRNRNVARGWEDLEDQMEWLVAFAERAKSDSTIHGYGVRKRRGICREEFFPGTTAQRTQCNDRATQADFPGCSAHTGMLAPG